ncbi:unnamed protein product [Symbiodinium sp. CCMP2592]|nr:unnamed protein product [Symbiodinium sp. CCMP2592]
MDSCTGSTAMAEVEVEMEAEVEARGLFWWRSFVAYPSRPSFSNTASSGMGNAWETPLANSGVSYSYPTWLEPIRKDDTGMFLIEPELRLAFGILFSLLTVCNPLDYMPDAYGKAFIACEAKGQKDAGHLSVGHRGIATRFHLSQVRILMPSHHLLEGVTMPMEIQFVHGSPITSSSWTPSNSFLKFCHHAWKIYLAPALRSVHLMPKPKSSGENSAGSILSVLVQEEIESEAKTQSETGDASQFAELLGKYDMASFDPQKLLDSAGLKGVLLYNQTSKEAEACKNVKWLLASDVVSVPPTVLEAFRGSMKGSATSPTGHTGQSLGGKDLEALVLAPEASSLFVGWTRLELYHRAGAYETAAMLFTLAFVFLAVCMHLLRTDPTPTPPVLLLTRQSFTGIALRCVMWLFIVAYFIGIIWVPLKAMEKASISTGLPWEAHLTFFSFMMASRLLELFVHALCGFSKEVTSLPTILMRVFLGTLAGADVYTDVNFIMIAYISGWPLWILAAMVFVIGVLIFQFALYFGAAIYYLFMISKTEKKDQKDTDWQNYVSALLKLLHFESLIVDIDEVKLDGQAEDEEEKEAPDAAHDDGYGSLSLPSGGFSYQPLTQKELDDTTDFLSRFDSFRQSISECMGVRVVGSGSDLIDGLYVATPTWTKENPEWKHDSGKMVISTRFSQNGKWQLGTPEDDGAIFEMQKSLPVVPEGVFAHKKGGAQRPYAYLQTVDVLKLEAALLSAPSIRSTHRRIKHLLRRSAPFWTTLETKHPYSAEDAGKRTVEIPGAQKLLVVLSKKSCCYDSATKLYVEAPSDDSQRDGEMLDSDRDTPGTCMLSGRTFEDPFVFVDGKAVTFHFVTDDDGAEPDRKFGFRAFIAAVNDEFESSDILPLLEVFPELDAAAETTGRKAEEGTTVDHILRECRKSSKLEEMRPFLLELPRWVNLFDPSAARRLVRLVATMLGASQKAAHSLNATSGGNSFAHTRRMVTLMTSSLRFFCEDALQAILQLMYLVEKRYNKMVMLSIVLSCSVSFANFLMALPRSYIYGAFRRARGTYYVNDTITVSGALPPAANGIYEQDGDYGMYRHRENPFAICGQWSFKHDRPASLSWGLHKISDKGDVDESTPLYKVNNWENCNGACLEALVPVFGWGRTEGDQTDLSVVRKAFPIQCDTLKVSACSGHPDAEGVYASCGFGMYKHTTNHRYYIRRVALPPKEWSSRWELLKNEGGSTWTRLFGNEATVSMRHGVEAPWSSDTTQDGSKATVTVEHKDSPFAEELCVYGGGSDVCNGKFFHSPFAQLDMGDGQKQPGRFYFHADHEVFLVELSGDGQRVCLIVEGGIKKDGHYVGLGSASESTFLAREPDDMPPPRVVQVSW